jgi:hypothetical protein
VGEINVWEKKKKKKEVFFNGCLKFLGDSHKPCARPILEKTCFIRKEEKRNFFTIKFVAMWKISVSLLICHFIFISHFTTTVIKRKKKKERACCYLSFHNIQDVQLVQCEKLQVLCSVKRNIIYLTFLIILLLCPLWKATFILTKKGFDLRVDLNLSFKGRKNHLGGDKKWTMKE